MNARDVLGPVQTKTGLEAGLEAPSCINHRMHKFMDPMSYPSPSR